MNLRHFNVFYSVLFCLLTPSIVEAASANPQLLQREIKSLTNTLDNTQGQYDQVSSEVTKLEQDLNTISKNYRRTELKIEAAQQRLQETNIKGEALDRDYEVQKTALAQQLQAMYTAGDQSHLRLLLRQEDPSDISRNLRYFEYLNSHRMKRIQKIDKTRQDIEETRQAAAKERLSLASLSTTLEEQKKALQSTLDAREQKLGLMKTDLRSQKRQLTKLKQEETQLLSKLEHLAQQREQTAILQDQNPPSKPAAVENRRAEAKAPPLTQTPPPNRAEEPTLVSYSQKFPFTKLKGKLAWPTTGRILHSYRSRRNEKQQWSGVVIQATGGAAVRSIAAGRVAYVGWMDGYGHLIIVEHDRHYISLYGYNRAVYKKEGQLIKANEMIAAVGNSGGQPQNGLYFEIRKGMSPQNPAIWCR